MLIPIIFWTSLMLMALLMEMLIEILMEMLAPTKILIRFMCPAAKGPICQPQDSPNSTLAK